MSDTTKETMSETVAATLLKLVGEHPGRMGRERAARIVGGYAVAWRDSDESELFERYVVARDWRRRDVTELVDALEKGGLLAQSAGPRPLLVLTRAGHRALDALEGIK